MSKMKTLSAVLFLAAAAPAWAAGPPPAQQQQLPAPKIVVLNNAAILQFSKVGQDVTRQAQAYSNQLKAELGGRAKALEAEGQQLTQQVAILAPDVKAQKVKAFEDKQAALQAEATRREATIQQGLQQAQQAIEASLSPIVQQVMNERGANMVLDKNAVVFATTNAFEITPVVIDRLNQKMPSFKVSFGAAPAPAKKK